MAATEPRRLRKKSYLSLRPLGIAASPGRRSNGHAGERFASRTNHGMDGWAKLMDSFLQAAALAPVGEPWTLAFGHARTARRLTATSQRARPRDGGVRQELAAGVVATPSKCCTLGRCLTCETLAMLALTNAETRLYRDS